MSISIEKTIDIDKILKSKMGSKAKFVPRFLVSWLKKIVHEAWEIEQEVIDQITELAVIMLSDDRTETYSVLSSQRMIGNEGIELAVILVGQVFQSHDFHIHLQITYCRLISPCSSW